MFNRRFCALLLILLILAQPLCAMAESGEAPVTHLATATATLRVRCEPDRNARANDLINDKEFVYIIEYGEEWCKVRTNYTEGYVLTKYLGDVRERSSNAAVLPQSQPDEPVYEDMPPFTTTPDTFYEGYDAYAVTTACIYEQPSTGARCIATVPTYQKLMVSEVSGGWCLARYKSYVGYIRTADLFKWDRIDPYVGDIPGMTKWPNLAFVNHSTKIYDLYTNEELKTINPGAAICVGERDEFGRYPLPYWRTTAYIDESDIATIMPVVDWQNAQPGDLISTMTTYFAVGVSSLQYQGRNWNIHLAGSMITGSTLQPGQNYDQYKVIGPYAKSTGYHEAPIMSSKALMGWGGGTCQVNTTFYMATIQLPLLVTHRKVHADVGIYYAPVGFDTAVGGGDINLTMVNTLPYPIRYQYLISDGVLTCCIFRD